MSESSPDISIIIPAHNEHDGLKQLLPRLLDAYPDAEIIVVDDGSTDETSAVCEELGVIHLKHPCNMGNGAAIKSGAREATREILVFMDADGQHDVSDIKSLLGKINSGFEMVVGARRVESHASFPRRFANSFYNQLASIMTGYNIEDLTSGFRAARRIHFNKFLYLLPNGFSYPTTSTMAFFRSGLPVGYVPITAGKREGKSHIKILKDGLRFFIIILKIGALFSPMRLFLPISGLLFLVGVSYYGYTYMTAGRFTNMSALILLSSLLIFLMGILAEFISSLHYMGVQEEQRINKRE